MTAQIPDHLIYEGDPYNIIGRKGDALPIPVDFGLSVGDWHTACWRGYVATYLCEGGDLLVQEFRVGRLRPDADWLPINGVEAEAEYVTRTVQENGQEVQRSWEACRVYADLKLPTGFSGGILIATGFISALYIHMGFAKPYQFETVHELLFHEGTLTEARDRSDDAAQWRDFVQRDREDYQRQWDELKAAGLSNQEINARLDPSGDPMENIRRFVEGRFSLDYGDWF